MWLFLGQRQHETAQLCVGMSTLFISCVALALRRALESADVTEMLSFRRMRGLFSKMLLASSRALPASLPTDCLTTLNRTIHVVTGHPGISFRKIFLEPPLQILGDGRDVVRVPVDQRLVEYSDQQSLEYSHAKSAEGRQRVAATR